jgi:hypothetical protein
MSRTDTQALGLVIRDGQSRALEENGGLRISRDKFLYRLVEHGQHGT